MRALLLLVLVACGSAPSPAPEAPEPAPVEPVEASPASEAPAAEPLPDGSACLRASDCASGVCEGQGCDDAHPGTCAPAQRACTRDRRPYCGCYGETFFSSGSCPGRRYERPGAC